MSRRKQPIGALRYIVGHSPLLPILATPYR